MIFQIIGWLGAFFFILSYFLLARGIWKQEQPRYHLFNLIGAICLVINALHFSDPANLAVNGVWAGIALMALYKWGTSYFRSKS
ncbi:CBU_0592 family membrane protein [Algoriphagus sp. D3-2-R+10]|uniref:CBU_0592 family membrane protein n=1 Tax=Algoriphagus aurantiacus TaxID=3103948 RepID=UPI003A5CC137